MSFNPFSFENSLEHLVNTKLTSGPTYEVQVDLANVDIYYGRQLGGPTASQQFQQAFIGQIGTTGLSGSAFFNQIGTTGSSGQAFFNQIGSSGSRGNAYFDTIYWNAFSPAISGGGGGATLLNGPGIDITTGVSGSRVSSLIQVGLGLTLNNPGNGQPYIIGNTINPTFVQGSTGIRVVQTGNTYVVSSTVAVTGSQYIGVQQNGATFTISYLGSQGGTAIPITGVSGAYAVFGSSGLQSSTVLNSSNIVGPTGNVMLYSPQGPTYSNLFSYSGGAFPRILTPFVESRYSNGILSLVPFTDQNYIESYGTNSQAFPLNISGAGGSPVSTKFDIPTGLVTINPNNSYPSGVQKIGASSVSQNVFLPNSGATYNIYMWGGGGAGLSGFPGGAGGFVKVQNIVAGAGGITFAFSNGGTGPGGNSLGLQINNGSGLLAAAVAPGGGAGGSAGRGAAFGELGGSYPGQGFSAGVTGGSGGIYTDFQTNGITGFIYRLSSGVTAQSGIFNNVQVTYGITGNFSANTILSGYNANPSSIVNNTIGITSTYYYPPGTTLVFQTTGITFNNSLYSLSGITYGILNLALPLTSLTGATFSRQALGGTFTIDTLSVNQQFQDGYVGGTFTGDGSGVDQMLIGATFFTGTTGVTLTIINSNTTDTSISGGVQIIFNTGLTGTFSRSLGNVLSPSVKITDPIFVQTNSIIQVQYQNTITYGQNGVLAPAIGPTGSGYGFYTGGGGTAGGGGGAGSAIFLSGFTGVTGAGSGTSPFFDTYNLAGQFGFGGSGGQGGLPYYVIELVSPGTQPNVLQVNGNEIVAGNLNVNGTLTVNQPGSGGTQAAIFSNLGGSGGGLRSIGIFNDQTIGPQLSFTSNIPSQANQGGNLAFTRNALQGNFNMDRPLTVQSTTIGDGPSGGSQLTLYSWNQYAYIYGGPQLQGAISFANNVYWTGSNYASQNSGYVGTNYSYAMNMATAYSNAGFVFRSAKYPQGTTNISSYLTDVASIDADGKVTALDFIATSDRRLKDNVQTVDSALDKVLKLRGVYFTRKDSDKRNLGVIAQEIEEIIPEVVFTGESPEQIKSVSYGSIVGLLIEAIKEQQEQIEKLKQNTI